MFHLSLLFPASTFPTHPKNLWIISFLIPFLHLLLHSFHILLTFLLSLGNTQGLLIPLATSKTIGCSSITPPAPQAKTCKVFSAKIQALPKSCFLSYLARSNTRGIPRSECKSALGHVLLPPGKRTIPCKWSPKSNKDLMASPRDIRLD